MANKNLAEGDLILLLKKKLFLLQEFLQLSQRQFVMIDSVAFDTVLDKKDQCILDLTKTDEVIEIWRGEYPRDLNDDEILLREQIPLLLTEITASEEQFEQQLNEKKMELSADSHQLRVHSQLKSYLKKGGTPSGKNLYFKH